MRIGILYSSRQRHNESAGDPRLTFIFSVPSTT